MHSVAPFFHRPPNLIPTLASLTTLMDRPRNSRDEYALGNTPYICGPFSPPPVNALRSASDQSS
jgi:hypothetical protein